MTNQKLSNAIFQLLHERGEDKTICPFQVARSLAPTGWRKLMQEIRDEARLGL